MNTPLDKLHDFYQPPSPPWTPQTVGWYIVFAAVGLLSLWVIVRAVQKWHANRYRREALRELAALPPEQFSALLKRAALMAWPREKVASLNGNAWLTFLSKSASSDAFQSAPGNRIEEIALSSATVSSEEEQALRKTTAEWIRRHRVQA